MQCANPECRHDATYLREGSIHLLELEAAADRRLAGNEEGFPTLSSPLRYFWLCGECTEVFSIAKWTPSGVVLVTRKKSVSTIDQIPLEMADPGSAARVRRPSSFISDLWAQRHEA
jgi:hypothetical protein